MWGVGTVGCGVGCGVWGGGGGVWGVGCKTAAGDPRNGFHVTVGVCRTHEVTLSVF